MDRLRILILGGTGEALRLARTIADDERFAATLSFAGATKAPVLPPIPHRTGGFGGAVGLADYLRRERIGLVVDATHPFAAQMSRHADEAARRAGVDLLAVRRPPWEPGPGDRWRVVADMETAAASIGEAPKRVFLTVGRKELGPFRAAAQHAYLLRSVDPPPADKLPPRVTVVSDRGPFALDDELRLLGAHGVEILVTKNSGGEATSAKLHAARELALPVIMVARPEKPAVAAVATPEEAFARLCARHDTLSIARRGV